MNAILISTRPYSTHKNDSHLSIVLRRNYKNELVTHIYNSLDKGYHLGHYFGNDIDKATADYLAR